MKSSQETKARRIHRRGVLKWLLVGAAGSTVNAFGIEPNRLSVTRTDVRSPLLPKNLDGLRIGVMADFHYDPQHNADLMEDAVAAMNRENVDVILMPGDFIISDATDFEGLMPILGQLRARYGVFASMGNHDGWNADAKMVRRAFHASGMQMLVNENRLISIRGSEVAIAGTDHVWRGNPDPVATLAGIADETPVLAMVHEPDYFDTMRARRELLLQVSGHTHGGQCRVPFIGYAPVKVKYGEKYLAGIYAQGDSRLFVTRGIGTTGLRVRFACLPEVAVLTMRSDFPA